MKRISTSSTTSSKADHRSQSLNLTTVKTTNETIPRTRQRIFGLEEAPIYHPTPEEFKDPIQYIQKIKPEAEQYGIIKIVPPKNYEPGFCLNTEIFRFRTRIQKMNSMEGGTRAKLNYLDKVQKFHRLHGKAIPRIPVLDKRPIDLYRLKKDVAERGGFHQVCEEKRWADIGRNMGYSRSQCTSMSNALKKTYMQVIMPYEHWLTKHKGGPSTPLQNDTYDENSDDEGDEDICVVCRKHGNDDNLVMCDDCDRTYHIFCVEPALSYVPSHEWYCVHCLTGAKGDYGFEDGGEYSLPEFHAFCDKFKKHWFSKEKPDMVAEEDCEDEFWRLVDNPHETCQVEYGADLHSTQHGSGFAPIERGIDGVKGDDPWNLNMIPVLPSSLFTHIKTDISGMMVPWLYIGMCFSAFCWHNEDHFTYSINYMHWGETKTWYGVPGEDTAKFEETMKKAVPELFEQQPNLLFQLVTMLSPGRLLKEKVRVYAVDQRPGEFVVTFPKAYHSGFNHGFNFCEAVNFAPMDWLHYGLECAKRYKAHRRQPCFSHDELLVNIAKMEIPQENLKWVKDALLDMQQREMTDRMTFYQQHPDIKQVAVPRDGNHDLFTNMEDQDHNQCLACHCYTYLSCVTCPCTKKVACFDHFDELCKCDDTKKLVQLRFTDNEIHSLVEMAGNQAENPPAWLKRAESILANADLTTEEAILMILKDATMKDVPNYYISEMEKTLANIKQWENQVSALLNSTTESQQPKHRKRNAPKYDGTRYRALLDLQKQASTMSLRSPTISLLETRINETAKLKNQIHHLLDNNSNTTLSDLEPIFLRGQNELHTDIEEMEPLLLARNQRQWVEILEPQVMQQQPLDYDAVTTLVKQAQEFKIPMTNANYLSVLSKAQLGEGWAKLAKRLLPSVSGKQVVTMDDLDEVLNVDGDVPVLQDIYQELDAFRSKVNSWLLLFKRTMMQSEQQQLLHRPTAEDIHNLQDQMRKLPRRMIQNESATLDLELKHLASWTAKVKKVLRPLPIPKTKTFTDLLGDVRSDILRILNQDGPEQPHAISLDNGEIGNQQHRTLKDSICICTQETSGSTLECSVCRKRYHMNCINIGESQSSNIDPYVCPVCDPSYNLTPFMKRPNFVDFCNVMEKAKILKLVPRTYPALFDIQMILTSYHDHLDTFCRSKQCVNSGDDKLMARKYLLELLALPISFTEEIELLHKVLHNTPSTISGTQQQQQHLSSLLLSQKDLDYDHHDVKPDIHHYSLSSLPSSSADSATKLAQNLSSTTQAMQPTPAPSSHKKSNPIRNKREAPPSTNLSRKKRSQNASLNGQGTLSLDTLHYSPS